MNNDGHRPPAALVVGVGPGLGSSLVRGFDRAGYAVAAVARRDRTTSAIAESSDIRTRIVPIRADATSDDDIQRATDTARRMLGHLDVVIYNAALIRADDPVELAPEDHLRTFDVNVLGALRLARTTLAAADPQRRMTFLVTGGMPEVKAAYTSLSVGKAALRAFTQALAQAHGSALRRIGMITVDGDIVPGTALDPDRLAQEFLDFHTADRRPWDVERVIKP